MRRSTCSHPSFFLEHSQMKYQHTTTHLLSYESDRSSKSDKEIDLRSRLSLFFDHSQLTDQCTTIHHSQSRLDLNLRWNQMLTRQPPSNDTSIPKLLSYESDRSTESDEEIDVGRFRKQRQSSELMGSFSNIVEAYFQGLITPSLRTSKELPRCTRI